MGSSFLQKQVERNDSWDLGALRDVQRERPVYRRGGVRDAESWWGEVIWRTGVGAGLDGGGEDSFDMLEK